MNVKARICKKTSCFGKQKTKQDKIKLKKKQNKLNKCSNAITKDIAGHRPQQFQTTILCFPKVESKRVNKRMTTKI